MRAAAARHTAAWLLWLLALAHHQRSAAAAAAAPQHQQPQLQQLRSLHEDTPQALSADLPPLSRWTHCIADGRLDIRWSVQASAAGKLHTGVVAAEHLDACTPARVAGCTWLAACDANPWCTELSHGELSGREKCLVLINKSNSSRTASVTLDTQAGGNWAAIIFGVVVTTLALLAVVLAGVASDLRALAKGTGHNRRPVVVARAQLPHLNGAAHAHTHHAQ